MNWITLRTIATRTRKVAQTLCCGLVLLIFPARAVGAEIGTFPGTSVLEKKLRLLPPQEQFGMGLDALIHVSGPIENGDAAKFQSIVSKLDVAPDGAAIVVRLDSSGGSFQEAIEIARIIRANKLQTFIERGSECLSACAVIFMAGTYLSDLRNQERQWRKIEWPAKLGFHRPFLPSFELPMSKDVFTGLSTEEIEGFFNDQFLGAFNVANDLIQEMLRVDPNAWSPELLVRMLTATNKSETGQFVYLNTVDDALIWNIDIINVEKPEDKSDEDRFASNFWLCYNSGRAIPAYNGIWPSIPEAEGNLEYLLDIGLEPGGPFFDREKITEDKLSYYTRVRGWWFGCEIHYEEVGGDPQVVFVHDEGKVTQTKPLQRFNPGLKLDQLFGSESESSDLEIEWELVRSSLEIADYEAFIARSPGTRFERLAKIRMASLSGTPEEDIKPIGTTPGQVFKQCDACPEMVVVPRGTVESNSVSRTIEPFAVGRFEITRDQFDSFLAQVDRPLNYCDREEARFKKYPQQDGSHPVVCVSWSDAKEYISWLVKKTGQPYRLLNEAERHFVSDEQENNLHVLLRKHYRDPVNGLSESDLAELQELCKYENLADYSHLQHEIFDKRWKGNRVHAVKCSDSFPFTSPVGSLKSYKFGVYDVLGNVEEWVEVCPADNADPEEAALGQERRNGEESKGTQCVGIPKGKSWYSLLGASLSPKRNNTPQRRDYQTGFRVALSVGDSGFVSETRKPIVYGVNKDAEKQRIDTRTGKIGKGGTKTSDESVTSKDAFLYEGLDFYGNDLSSSKVAGVGACYEQCNASSECKAFSFNTATQSGDNCFLKTGTGIPDGNADAVSGIPARASQIDATVFKVGSIDRSAILLNIDLAGGETVGGEKVTKKTAESCRLACVESDECQAFSYALGSEECSLKSTHGVEKAKKRTVSGIKTNLTFAPTPKSF